MEYQSNLFIQQFTYKLVYQIIGQINSKRYIAAFPLKMLLKLLIKNLVQIYKQILAIYLKFLRKKLNEEFDIFRSPLRLVFRNIAYAKEQQNKSNKSFIKKKKNCQIIKIEARKAKIKISNKQSAIYIIYMKYFQKVFC
ncbi:unnamed protein product [Paramecium sonneborni]|uniref:Uncharacterized protein n=1 Tax=Paramecium sonneborni TaxID=65129 RepID=A0A8S1RI42_9CILI|nr:unnamed protein product [Paramecium sonneborni]